MPAAAPATVRASILELQRGAGNRAVASLLQRKVGWSDRQGDRAPAGGARRHRVDRGRRLPARLHRGTHRPYAGWRELVDPKPAAGPARLRGGIDAKDTAPVRDVALDQVEQQLEESGQTQLVIVLPQSGLTSEFSKDGTRDFDAGRYVTEIVTRLQTEKLWRDGTGTPIDASPSVRRVTMAGHSGAGAALSNMTNEAVKAKSGVKPPKGAPAPASSALTGDLVIYDAINGSQLGRFIEWTTMRLEQDFAFLTDDSISDEAKLFHLQSAQKLRGFTTDYYIDQYIRLDNFIEAWFERHKRKLGAWAPCLRENYALDYLPVDHEELMRGSLADRPRAAGTGRSSRRSGTSTLRAGSRTPRAPRCPSR